MRYIIVRGELLLYTPVVVRSNRIPPPCVFATQDSTRKDSTQNFNIKSHDHELTHIRVGDVQTHIIMANEINAATVNATAVASVESSNATQVAQPVEPTEGLQKKFALKVMRVQLFDQDDIVNVQLQFDKSFPGFMKTKDGDYVESEINTISLSRSSLTRQLCDSAEAIAMLRDGQKTPLTRAQLSTLLHGAVLTVSRTFHRAGFVPEGRDALTRNQWFSEIEDAKLTDFAINLLQNVIVQRMMNE